FENDNIARIMGYGDYQLGNVTISMVRFLRTKDKAPEDIIKCIKNIQVRLNATVRNVRIDNGTEFVNQTLCELYENVGVSHQTSIARTPEQNDVVESYPTNDNDDLGKLDAKADIGLGLHSMTLATSYSGLVPNTVSQQPSAALRAVDLADSPVSTSIYQDAPSSSTPSTQEQEQSPNISQGFKESPKHQSFVMIHLMNLLKKNQLLKGHH
ncbi:integrase, catalytic region, zinc finger, CCHC-type containing protein, partial [Tanacetum coccineum]